MRVCVSMSANLQMMDHPQVILYLRQMFCSIQYHFPFPFMVMSAKRNGGNSRGFDFNVSDILFVSWRKTFCETQECRLRKLQVPIGVLWSPCMWYSGKSGDHRLILIEAVFYEVFVISEPCFS